MYGLRNVLLRGLYRYRSLKIKALYCLKDILNILNNSTEKGLLEVSASSSKNFLPTPNKDLY